MPPLTALVADKTPAPPTAEITGERREVTVLFADVSDYTATTHNLDSEDVYLIVDEAMRLLVDVVSRYEGTIDKFTGDGLMALFGAPTAHENDPERAVRAALEMQTALLPLQQRVKQRYGRDFLVRIGLNTGPVIAGKVGSDLHTEYTVIGDTVNMASRLEKLARPGAVLVSFTTYQRTLPIFHYTTTPPLTVKGITEPVIAYQPVTLRERPGRVRGLPGMQVPMVGRQDALRQLQEAHTHVQTHRRRQIALITGEAGLGKSRLVAEFRATLPPDATAVHQGACLAYARARPFWVLTELLRDLTGLLETDTPDTQWDTLQNLITSLNLPVNDVLPYLANLFSVSHLQPPIQARLRLLDAAMLQQQTHAALRLLLLAKAHQRPTILIFEDLHWVDPASRDFLDHFIRTAPDEPYFLILISRTLERQTVIQPLIAAASQASSSLMDIQLQALSEREGHLLVDQLIPADTPEAQALKQRIAGRAEGNPFYMEEIVRMLLDQGALVNHQGHYTPSPHADKLLTEVPGTLKGLILARFDRLDEPQRRTLQKAAVLGRSFPLELLQALDHTAPAAVASHLQEACDRQFLKAEPFGLGPGYAFQHTLVQEAVYETLLKRDRQRLHEQVALTIEKYPTWTPGEQSEVLAYHYSESTRPEKAIPHLIQAAENAAARYANETAAQHYRRAITLIEATATPPDSSYYSLQVDLARALKMTGALAEANRLLSDTVAKLTTSHLHRDLESVSPVLARALRELADVRWREGALEDAVSHLEIGLELLGGDVEQTHQPLWRTLMERLAWVRFRQGKLEEAFELASAAMGGVEMEPAEDPATLAGLYNTLGGLHWQQGNLSEAIAYVERSLALYQTLGYTLGVANAHSNLGVLHFRQGTWRKAAESWEQASALRQEIGDVQNQAHSLSNLGLLRLAMGDHQTAGGILDESLTIYEQLGDNFGIAHVNANLTQLAIIEGRWGEAAGHVQTVRSLADTIGSVDLRAQARWLEALILAGRNDLPGSLKLAEQAAQLAEEAGGVDSEADCLRVLGSLRGRAGATLAAEALLGKSVELCRQRNDPYRQGLALLELGRLYYNLAVTRHAGYLDWRAKALASLNEAHKRLEGLGAAYDLRLVEELELELESEFRDSRAYSEPHLTAVAEGAHTTVALIWLELQARPDADAEEVFEVMRGVTAGLQAIVAENEGEAIRRPDGLTIAFGAPVTHEDDAERAVRTAQRLLQYLQAPEQGAAGLLSVRLAVSQGKAVAGRLGDGTHSEFVVTGEPVQTAQQAATTAPAGQVWVTAAVRAATERLFTYEAFDEPGSTGAEEPGSRDEFSPSPPHPLTLSRLTGWREQPGRARGLPGARARLVGRDQPLKAMNNLAQNLGQGRGGLIWIQGEAGIGKSRLMEEFGVAMRGAGAQVWTGQCSSQRKTLAFSLFSNLLTQIFNLEMTDTPGQLQKKIEGTMEGWPAEVEATQPYLELLCGLRPGGLIGDRLTTLEPDQLRQQIFVALRTLFKGTAATRALVLLLDDLHWADAMSAEVLLFLSHLVTSAPILLVCAMRRGEGWAADERLQKAQRLQATQTVQIALNRLSTSESAALLGELLAGVELPGALEAAVLERSEGNPYYIEEFVRTLVEMGYVERRGKEWVVNVGLNLADLPVPTSLEALIRSRVDALPVDLKGLLQWVAVIGRRFDAALLEAITGEPGVAAGLTQLEARDMLQQTAETGQWHFTHYLVETTVYNTLLKARRRELHGQIAETLERGWQEAAESHAEELAYHFSRAGEDARALPYLTLAGERAAARYANQEALAYFQQAHEALAYLSDTALELRWRIITGLGEVYLFTGRYEESTTVLKSGLPLVEGAEGRRPSQVTKAQHASLHRRLGQVAQKKGEFEKAHDHFATALGLLAQPADDDERVEAARCLNDSAWNYFLQGHLERARQACERSLEFATQAQGLSELSMAENVMGGIFYRQGEWEEALSHTMKAMVLREQMGYTWGVAATNSNLGILAVAAGHWNKAASFFQQSLALRQEMGDVEGVAIAHNNLGILARDQGDLDRAESHFRESLNVATSLKMAFHAVAARLGLAQTLLWKGDVEPAAEVMATGAAQAEVIGAQDLLAEIYRVQAEISLAQGEHTPANTLLRRAISQAQKSGNRNHEAAAWRVTAENERRRGDLGAASQAIQRARQSLAEVTNQLEAARVAVQAGQLSLTAGCPDQARRELLSAQATFRNLGADLDLKQTQTILQEIQRSLSSELG